MGPHCTPLLRSRTSIRYTLLPHQRRLKRYLVSSSSISCSVLKFSLLLQLISILYWLEKAQLSSLLIEMILSKQADDNILRAF